MPFKKFLIIFILIIHLFSCQANELNILVSNSISAFDEEIISYLFSNFPIPPTINSFSNPENFFNQILIFPSVSNANYYFVAHSMFPEGPFEKVSFDINFNDLLLDSYIYNDLYTDPHSSSYYKIYACMTQDNICISSEAVKTEALTFLETRSPNAGQLISSERTEVLFSILLRFGFDQLGLFNTSSNSSLVVTLDNIFGCTREEKESGTCSEEQDAVFAVPEFYKIKYQTTYKGNPQTASGLICLPSSEGTDRLDNYYQNKPIIAAQHSFTFKESEVPSTFQFLDPEALAGIIRGFVNRYLQDNPIIQNVSIAQTISILGTNCSLNLDLDLQIDSLDALINFPVNVDIEFCPENPNLGLVATALLGNFFGELQNLLLSGIASSISSSTGETQTATGEALDLDFNVSQSTTEGGTTSSLSISGTINILETFKGLTIVLDTYLLDQGINLSITDFLSDLSSGELLSLTDFQFNDILSATLLEIYCILGYPTFLPDYLGYQDSSKILHPYLDKDASAHAIIDFIQAGTSFLEQQGYQSNQKLYMFGYDEGAYATIASTSYLEKFPTLLPNISLDGVVVGGGFYELSNIFKRHFAGSSLLQGEELSFYFHQLSQNILSNSLFNSPLLANSRFQLNQIFTEDYITQIENGIFDGANDTISDFDFSNTIYDIFQGSFIRSMQQNNTLLSGNIIREINKNSLQSFSSSVPIHFFYNLLDRETGDSTGTLTRQFANKIQQRSSGCISSSELIFLRDVIPGLNIGGSFLSAIAEDIASFTFIGQVFESFYGDELNIHLLNSFQMILESFSFIQMREQNRILCSE